jgi:putative transposase
MDYRDRIQRPKAINAPKQAHELTFSCYRRFPFLSKDRACGWLVDSIENARRKLGYSLWGYVFMPDHVHLLVYPLQEIYNTSEFLKLVKEPVSRKAVEFLKSVAPEWLDRIRVHHGKRSQHHFWQPGRGFDRNADNARTLLKMLDYIHANPERIRLVADPREWKWSSAGWYAGAPLNNLKPDPIPYDWLEI